MPFKKYEVQCFYIFFGKRSYYLLKKTQIQQHLGKKKKKKKPHVWKTQQDVLSQARHQLNTVFI